MKECNCSWQYWTERYCKPAITTNKKEDAGLHTQFQHLPCPHQVMTNAPAAICS
jgi:hypothetical protein